MTVVGANYLLNSNARILTYPLFLDAIFKDGYKLLLFTPSVPGARCFMASFSEYSTLSITHRLRVNVSLQHDI